MARIRHIAILTEDVEKLVKFYTEGFGLKIVHGVGTATYLTDGHINLAIIPIGPEREIEGPQFRPASIISVSRSKMSRQCAKLVRTERRDGVRKRPPNREAEYRVLDPDGNPIDLSQHGWPH